MSECCGCGKEFTPRTQLILGKSYKLKYCEDCMEKAREDYRKLSEQLKAKCNPSKKKE